MTELKDLIEEVRILKKELRELQDTVLTLKNKSIASRNKCLLRELNMKPIVKQQMHIDNWLTMFNVHPEHLEKVFAYDLIQGVIHCIKMNITATKVQIPLLAFTENKNKIFVFTENNHWMVLEYAVLRTFLVKLSQKFTQAYIKWLTDHPDNSLEMNISNQIKIINSEKLLSSGVKTIHRWFWLTYNVPFE